MSLVGLFDAVKLFERIPDIQAQVMPNVNPASSVIPWGINAFSVTREQAMMVPAVARSRDIICQTIGTLPLDLWSADGRKLNKYGWMEQPDIASPRSVTWSWLLDSMLMFGVGYLQITSTYAEDNRPSRFTWIDPRRVTSQTNNAGTRIMYYELDGTRLPDNGVGSLVTFQSPDEGILTRGAQTIATAAALELASYNMAKEPAPLTVLKNTGIDMPGDQVSELLANWKQARQTRATAYLNQAINAEAFGFDPKAMQLVEARQYTSTEIARMCNLPAWAVDGETGDSMTYSNIVDRRRDLIASLRGLASAVEDRLTMNDITPQGTYVRWNLDDFLRANALERAQVLTALLTAGIITIEEARAQEGLAPRGNE